LTVWEAQFGDFANGAQIIIDNYLTSGESKWKVESGLVMNLPHGMDGQGPEHSSCRIERFLQLMNDGWCNLTKDSLLSENYRPLRQSNMHVVCCSTAGNLFHAYRRQVRRDFRKPLINIMNKKLLKFRDSSTNFAFLNNNKFSTLIGEEDSTITPQ
jgi:2-oxoglutarate dehydrogenase E1 component